ncbi:MAG: helix-turn-helix domain-containing protein [Roseateles sp.]|uniref:helix-turn-helix domain-containing protein n=1 Tax=Roseateles sp. TaxID=1971397 RepID=UPI0040352BB6
MHAASVTLANRSHPADRGGHGRLDWLYEQACLQLQRHLADSSYDVTRLVGELGVSRPTLYRAFMRQGDTVAGCLRRARLARVCELMAEPPFRTPIETLAYQCGFEDVRTFNRCFRKAFGMSAGAWRAHALARKLSPMDARLGNWSSAAAAVSA